MNNKLILKAMKNIKRLMLLAMVVISTSCAVQTTHPVCRPDNAIMITWQANGYYYYRIGEDFKADSIKCDILDRMVEMEYPGEGRIICAKDIFHFDFYYGVK